MSNENIFLPTFPATSAVSTTTDGDSLNLQISEEAEDSYTLTFPPDNTIGFLKNTGDGTLEWDSVTVTSQDSMTVKYEDVNMLGQSTYNVLSSKEVILFSDTDLTTKNINLPSISSITAGSSKLFIFIKNSTNTYIIDPDNSDTIDGLSSLNLVQNFDRIKIFSTTVGWFTI